MSIILLTQPISRGVLELGQAWPLEVNDMAHAKEATQETRTGASLALYYALTQLFRIGVAVGIAGFMLYRLVRRPFAGPPCPFCGEVHTEPGPCYTELCSTSHASD